MKKNSLILLAFISLVALFTSCEPEYFKPTNPKYEVGDLITIDGVEAVVYFVSFDGEHGKAIAAKSEAGLQWSTAGTLVGANSNTDGEFNQNQVQSRPIVNGDDWRLKFPSFYATFNTAPHTLPISADVLKTVKWYMPSVEEFKFIFEYFDIINAAIPNEVGYKKLRENVRYWTSTEVDEINAKIVMYMDGTSIVEDKMRTNNDAYYRAIINF